MNDLISREALLKDISRIGGFPWSEWETAGVFDIVNKQPSVDAAPVVRCWECRYQSHDQEYGKRWCNHGSGCREVRADGQGYCDLGARMDLPEGEEAQND